MAAMFRSAKLTFALANLALGTAVCAQSPPQPADDVIHASLVQNTLTYQGAPFHAVLEIAAEKGDPAYAAQLELDWQAADIYRLTITSKDFDSTVILHGTEMEEHHRGDFLPIWLQAFTRALLDPMPHSAYILGRGLTYKALPYFTSNCVERNDRTNGISDDLTYTRICFDTNTARLDNYRDFSYFMIYSDFAPFQTKQIAHTYKTVDGEHIWLDGHLTQLEALSGDTAHLFKIVRPTPATDRIATTLVSTSKEESLLEFAPKNAQWPTVHEGKLDGYMIVHALTDRTGQVREAINYNSDNEALASFGRQVALQYKFKPLVIDGVAQQIEMPLVLHFSTKIDNPVPELDDAQSRKLISGCEVPRSIADPASAGQQIELIVYVTEAGHFQTAGSSDRKVLPLALFTVFEPCHFSVYKQNGQALPYHAHLKVTAK